MLNYNNGTKCNECDIPNKNKFEEMFFPFYVVLVNDCFIYYPVIMKCNKALSSPLGLAVLNL